MTAISKAVSTNAGSVGRQAAVIAAASGLVLSAGVPAQAAGVDRAANAVTAVTALQTETGSVAVPADVELSFDRASVTSEAPAATVTAQATVTEEVAPAPEPEPVEAAPVAEVEAKVEAKVETKSAPAPAAEASSSNVGAALVASAYSQIGVAQDCTAMVEKALRSVGKSVGDIAPEHFYRYGSVVGTPASGDLVISAGHVAIYVGNGQAISGGFAGMDTVLHSLSALSGYSFVRVN